MKKRKKLHVEDFFTFASIESKMGEKQSGRTKINKQTNKHNAIEHKTAEKLIFPL